LEENERIRTLAQKWLDGSITPEEEREYADWYNRTEGTLDVPEDREAIKARMMRNIAEGLPREHKTYRLWWAAAAAVALTAIIGYATLRRTTPEKTDKPVPAIAAAGKDILPGKTGALLTLANGQTILLDTARNGQLAQAVTKTNTALTVQGQSETAYNTLTTPRARQEQLVLSDGTKVWLDAESSIRFPETFGAQRRVEIEGQAYFEVARDASRPFIVATPRTTVRVLGTSFNVSAYSGENTVTTLVEGSVRVATATDSVQLVPGQQSIDEAGSQGLGGGSLRKTPADVELSTAWKNGLTAFRKASIQTIMQQVRRWYDVDVEYKGRLPERTFTGEIPRAANLSQLLKLFEISNIHFTIDAEHKKLVVMP